MKWRALLVALLSFSASADITTPSNGTVGGQIQNSDLTSSTNKIPLTLRFQPLGWINPVINVNNTIPATSGTTESRDPVVSVGTSALYAFYTHGSNTSLFQIGYSTTSNNDQRFDFTYNGYAITAGTSGQNDQCGAFSPSPPYQDGSGTWHMLYTSVTDRASNNCAGGLSGQADIPWNISEATASSLAGPWTKTNDSSTAGLVINGNTPCGGNSTCHTLDPWVVPASISSSGLYELYVSQFVGGYRKVVQYTSPTGLQTSWTRVGVVFDSVNAGSSWINPNPINATATANGVSYNINTVGSTTFTSCGASSNTVGTVFVATGACGGTGTVLLNSASLSSGVAYSINSVGTTNFLSCGATANTVGTIFTATGSCSGTGDVLFIDDVENPSVFKWGNIWYMTVDDSEESISHATVSNSGATCCKSFNEQDGGPLAGSNFGNNAAQPWDATGDDALGVFQMNNQLFAIYQGIGPNGGQLGIANLGKNFFRQPVIPTNTPATNNVTITGIAQPTQPQVAAVGGTGTSWGYAVVCFGPDGSYATPSGTAVTSGPATLSTTAYMQINVFPSPGSAYCQVYRRVASGTPSTTGKISYQVTPYADNGASYSFFDFGQAGDGTEPLTTYAQPTTGYLNMATGQTIATLATCNSSTKGSTGWVTNGVASPTYLATVGTTGSTVAPVFCNGSNWVYH